MYLSINGAILVESNNLGTSPSESRISNALNKNINHRSQHRALHKHPSSSMHKPSQKELSARPCATASTKTRRLERSPAL